MASVLDDITSMITQDSSAGTLRTETPAMETPATTPTNETPEPIAQTTAEPTPVEPTAQPVATEIKTEVETPVQAEAQATVAVDPTVTPEPKTEVDQSKILDELSGGKVKSADDLKRIIEEYESAQQKLQDPNVEYANKLTAWEESGRPAELFHAIQDIDTDELSAEDAIKVNLKLQNPEWTEEDINLYVERKYNQDPDAYDEKAIKYGELMMKSDSAEAIKEISALKEMATVKTDRKAVQEQVRQAEQSRQEAWKSNLPNLVNDFKEMHFKIDDKGTTYKWTVTPEQQKELSDVMSQIVLNAPVNFDEKGKEAFIETMKSEFLKRNINQIAKGINNHVATQKTVEKIIEVHNPTGAQTPQGAPSIQKRSSEDEAFDKILGIEGIKPRR